MFDASTINTRCGQAAIPTLGFGTWRGRNQDSDLTPAIVHALKSGYRLIDTAVYYNTEDQVGRALKEAGVNRENVWIQTKLWPDSYEPAKLKKTVDGILERLQESYVDSLLLHWPVFSPQCPGYPTMKEVWSALEEVHRDGKARHIGISNFQPWHIKELMSFANVKPIVNQCEINPWWPQEELAEICAKYEIVLQAYRPFGNLAKRDTLAENAKLLTDEPALVEIAKAHGATAQQVILSWLRQRGIAVVAKSATSQRIEANLKLINLSPSEMNSIADIQHREKMCPSPFPFDVLAHP